MLQLNAMKQNMSCSARNHAVALLACYAAVRFFSYCFFYDYFVANSAIPKGKACFDRVEKRFDGMSDSFRGVAFFRDWRQL